MKTWILIATISLGVGLPSNRSHAQVESPSPIPGSYLGTCPATNFNIATQVITAQCYPINHQPLVNTSLAYGACDPSAGQPWNDDGVLHCFAPAGSMGMGNIIPRGSYAKSCNRMKIEMGRSPTFRFYTMSGWCFYNYNNGQDNGSNPTAFTLSDTRTGHCDMSQDIWNDQSVLHCYWIANAQKKKKKAK